MEEGGVGIVVGFSIFFVVAGFGDVCCVGWSEIGR